MFGQKNKNFLVQMKYFLWKKSLPAFFLAQKIIAKNIHLNNFKSVVF